MNVNNIAVKRALLSVSDKSGLVEFASRLSELNIEILSTGGTHRLLQKAGLPTREVSDFTQFPEIMDGRVKTLHPKIHGGILGLRDAHQHVAEEQGIPWIDLVVVNLYPFAATVQKSGCSFEEALENIDIGGPSLIRAAAKNLGWTAVLVDPRDYATLAAELKEQGSLRLATRKRLAAKAFAHTAQYDTLIQDYLQTVSSLLASGGDAPRNEEALFPEEMSLSLQKYADLRYGENPHQAACAYRFLPQMPGLLSARQHQGKLLSYNNLTDADAALACVQEFTAPACVIVKHANPCGVALADSIEAAFESAFAADPLSAFGGIVALNRPCTAALANVLSRRFLEVLLAPGYEPEALQVLAAKTQLRVLELQPENAPFTPKEYKFIQGGVLIQQKDTQPLRREQLNVVTQVQPEPALFESLLFAWRVLKHLKSNAIVVAKEQRTLGMGTGQVSRIDAVDLALRKAESRLEGSILASEAFFPFRDSIDRIAQFSKSAATGIRAIIQPGGSVKDGEVIQACNEHGIAMVFTGQRCFKH